MVIFYSNHECASCSRSVRGDFCQERRFAKIWRIIIVTNKTVVSGGKMLKRVSVCQVALNPQFCTIKDYKTLENLGFNVAWMDDNGDNSYEIVTICEEFLTEESEDWNLN